MTPLTEPCTGGESGPRAALSAARLAAVQALYEVDVAGTPADAVVGEFLAERWSRATAEVGTEATAPDRELFRLLVLGVAGQLAEVDRAVAGALTGTWTLARLEVLLRAILRAGAFELMVRPAVPARVVITEYLEVAHAFFAGTEPGLVNGVLDRLARTLRPGELGEGSDDHAATGR